MESYMDKIKTKSYDIKYYDEVFPLIQIRENPKILYVLRDHRINDDEKYIDLFPDNGELKKFNLYVLLESQNYTLDTPRRNSAHYEDLSDVQERLVIKNMPNDNVHVKLMDNRAVFEFNSPLTGFFFSMVSDMSNTPITSIKMFNFEFNSHAVDKKYYDKVIKYLTVFFVLIFLKYPSPIGSDYLDNILTEYIPTILSKLKDNYEKITNFNSVEYIIKSFQFTDLINVNKDTMEDKIEKLKEFYKMNNEHELMNDYMFIYSIQHLLINYIHNCNISEEKNSELCYKLFGTYFLYIFSNPNPKLSDSKLMNFLTYNYSFNQYDFYMDSKLNIEVKLENFTNKRTYEKLNKISPRVKDFYIKQPLFNYMELYKPFPSPDDKNYEREMGKLISLSTYLNFILDIEMVNEIMINKSDLYVICCGAFHVLTINKCLDAIVK